MKTIYKNLVPGIFLTAFAAFAAPVFAQDVCADIEANTALYNKFLTNYEPKNPVAQRKIAVEAGKEYIQKYEACTTTTKDASGNETKTPTYAAQITYFKENIPGLEKDIAAVETFERDKPMYDKFKAGLAAKNVADIVSSGKEILSRYPDDKDSLDVAVTIASATFDELLAKPTASAYNADLITYAKKAIEKIEAGKTSPTFGYGNYKLGKKENALGVLNYSIGLAMLTDPAQKKEASTYLYKSAQYESVFRNRPLLYQAIGANYLDEFIAIDKKRNDIIKANENKDNEESLALEAMQRGYADRAIDAYARAYKVAKADKTFKKDYIDSLAAKLKDLYAFRFRDKTLDAVDPYVATVTSKPLADPKVAVVPVQEEVPATTPATSGSTTTPAKPVSSTTAPATTTKVETTATTKPATKKPTPKKKGTR